MNNEIIHSYHQMKYKIWQFLLLSILIIIVDIFLFYYLFYQTIIGAIIIVFCILCSIIFIYGFIIGAKYSINKNILLKNDRIVLPYVYSYNYPCRIDINNVKYKSIKAIDNQEEIEKIVLFLKNNKVHFHSMHMVDENNFIKRKDEVLTLKINNNNNYYYMILIKKWFKDYETFYNDLLKKLY